MGLQRCLFHLKNRHFQSLHAHTHTDLKNWIPSHYGIDARRFVCLFGCCCCFFLQQLLSAVKFLQLEVYDVVKSCLSHVRDVGGSTGTINDHTGLLLWFALLCFTLTTVGSLWHVFTLAVRKCKKCFFFLSLWTFCKHVHHIPSLSKQFIVHVQRNESLADRSEHSSLPTLMVESQCAIEFDCRAVCVEDGRCSTMHRTKKKGKKDRAESNLDTFTRSKDSFSNHLVIACYYRRQLFVLPSVTCVYLWR